MSKCRLRDQLDVSLGWIFPRSLIHNSGANEAGQTRPWRLRIRCSAFVHKKLEEQVRREQIRVQLLLCTPMYIDHNRTSHFY